MKVELTSKKREVLGYQHRDRLPLLVRDEDGDLFYVTDLNGDEDNPSTKVEALLLNGKARTVSNFLFLIGSAEVLSPEESVILSNE
jgi:hypothetical protein